MLHEQSHCHLTIAELKPLFHNRLSGIVEVFNHYGVDARLVGTLGRAAAIHHESISFMTFGGLEDIDVVIVNSTRCGNEEEALTAVKQTALPFRIDVHFGTKILFGKSGVRIRYKGIEIPVDPITLEHRVGRLCDTDIPTFDPRTLAHLSVLYGPMRPNDWINILDYLRKIKGQVNVLPEEYFTPFHELEDQRRTRYPMDSCLGSLRWQYHKHVQYDRRTSLSRIVSPLRSVIESKCGWIEAPHA